jgi:hypothetical protein
LEDELARSRLFLADELGLTKPSFAYPSGNFGERERQAVVRAGYVCACAVGGAWGNGYLSDTYALSRAEVRSWYSMRQFRAIIGARLKFPLLVLPVRQRLEAIRGRSRRS